MIQQITISSRGAALRASGPAGCERGRLLRAGNPLRRASPGSRGFVNLLTLSETLAASEPKQQGFWQGCRIGTQRRKGGSAACAAIPHADVPCLAIGEYSLIAGDQRGAKHPCRGNDHSIRRVGVGQARKARAVESNLRSQVDQSDARRGECSGHPLVDGSDRLRRSLASSIASSQTEIAATATSPEIAACSMRRTVAFESSPAVPSMVQIQTWVSSTRGPGAGFPLVLGIPGFVEGCHDVTMNRD